MLWSYSKLAICSDKFGLLKIQEHSANFDHYLTANANLAGQLLKLGGVCDERMYVVLHGGLYEHPDSIPKLTTITKCKNPNTNSKIQFV